MSLLGVDVHLKSLDKRFSCPFRSFWKASLHGTSIVHCMYVTVQLAICESDSESLPRLREISFPHAPTLTPPQVQAPPQQLWTALSPLDISPKPVILPPSVLKLQSAFSCTSLPATSLQQRQRHNLKHLTPPQVILPSPPSSSSSLPPSSPREPVKHAQPTYRAAPRIIPHLDVRGGLKDAQP